jgi:hypothetical protein
MTRTLAVPNGLSSTDPFDPSAQPTRRTQGYDALVIMAGVGGTGAHLVSGVFNLEGPFSHTCLHGAGR